MATLRSAASSDASSLRATRLAVCAASVAVLSARIRDVQHVPRLVLDQDGSPVESLKVLASTAMLYSYEKLCARLLLRLGFKKLPSTLTAMLSLFVIHRAIQRAIDRETSDRFAKALGPGVNFLGKWMSLFVAPPLATLDKSMAILPPYGAGVWLNVTALLAGGWAATHVLAAAIATKLAPPAAPVKQKPSAGKTTQRRLTWPATPTTESTIAEKAVTTSAMTQEEAMRRAWVILGAASYAGVSCFSVLPKPLHRPLGWMCEFSTTVGSFMHAKLLPNAVQQLVHPLVACAFVTNAGFRFVGPAAPYLDEGRGAGDRIFQLLPAAMAALGVRMYQTSPLWYDSTDNMLCTVATCGISGCFSLLVSVLVGLAKQSPLSFPPPLSLPLLHRHVMTALAIEGSKAVGPEGDPKIAVASALVTGCIGASFGKALLGTCPARFNVSSPLVRGIATGCSSISTGTASLIAAGDSDAGAIAGISMCLSATAHTFMLQMPGVVPGIRKLASLRTVRKRRIG